MEIGFEVLRAIFDPVTLLLIVLGTVGGIFFGVAPGLNGPIGVTLLLPFTFTLHPAAGLLMLGGIYMGSSYGGSISGILLNMPGTAEAACTAMEGYPLAQRGEAQRTLYISILSCVLGGLIGVVVLILFTPLLASFALLFGPPEMFLVAIAGLAVVGGLAGRNLWKGLFAVSFGIFVSQIGADVVTGHDRFTFGIPALRGGIPLIPVAIGLFAIAEMLVQAGRRGGSRVEPPSRQVSFRAVAREFFRRPWLAIKSSILGTLIGVLPGAGGAVAAFVAYGETKRTSKNKDLFGKGNIEGVIAAESANNAAVGGSLVPLLALGIPGSATAAVLYGALMIHGLIPGPRLFADHPQIVYTFLFGMPITVLIMGVVGVYGVSIFSRALKIRTAIIVPSVLVFCMFGAYSVRNSLFDVLLAICFGLLGLAFRRAAIPAPPIVLGVILGPIAEEALRQSLAIAGAQGVSFAGYLAGRPLSLGILALLTLIVYTSLRAIRGNRKTATP